MTGAGFGGCTVSLVHEDAVEDIKDQVTQGYQAKTGLTPTFYKVEIGMGPEKYWGGRTQWRF